MKFQEGKKHVPLYQSSIIQLNKFHHKSLENYGIKHIIIFKSSTTTQVQTTNSTASTKRKVLQSAALKFDPLGLHSRAVIAYKIFLQKLWQDKLQGDEIFLAHLQQ